MIFCVYKGEMHENMILICPPLIITEEQITEEMAKMDEVLSIVDSKFI